MEQSRACIECKQIKPLTEFLIDRSKKTGYKSRCLLCGRIKTNFKSALDSPRNINPAKGTGKSAAENYKIWVANNPEKRRQINNKFRSKPENQQKHAIKMREYRKRNPDAYQNWVNSNPDKANSNWNKRRKNFDEANLYKVTKSEMLRIYSSPCFYCGSKTRIQADHVMPISRGGKHSIGNLVSSCQPCNLSKKDKTIMEWRKWKNAEKRI